MGYNSSSNTRFIKINFGWNLTYYDQYN